MSTGTPTQTRIAPPKRLPRRLTVAMRVLIVVVALVAVLWAGRCAARMVVLSHSSLDAHGLRFVKDLSDSKNLEVTGAHLAPFLIPRVAGTPNNALVREHVVFTLRSLGWHVTEDVFTHQTPLGERRFGNIIATRHPNVAVKLITLAAHLDSKYFAPPATGSPSREFVGATDSAASCALLMDIAASVSSLLATQQDRSVADPTVELGIDLQLIFFDGEEAFETWSATDSLYGSRHLARRWNIQSVSVKNAFTSAVSTFLYKDTTEVLIVLDLLGIQLGKKGSQVPNLHPETSTYFAHLLDIQTRLAEAKLLSQTALDLYHKGPNSLYFIPNVVDSKGIEDDHTPFEGLGVPIVHLIPAPFPEVWHTFDDDRSSLSHDTLKDLALIFRVFITERLGYML